MGAGLKKDLRVSRVGPGGSLNATIRISLSKIPNTFRLPASQFSRSIPDNKLPKAATPPSPPPATGVLPYLLFRGKMKKGIHPQMQWITYVTQSGRLMTVMMTKIHETGKVYHFRAKRQMAQGLGQIAKFKRRYGEQEGEPEKK